MSEHHVIVVAESELSDGSKVYGVSVLGHPQWSLDCVTESDASELAQRIVAAIKDHTNDSAIVHFNY